MAHGRRAAPGRRPLARWIVLGLVVLLLAAVLWIVVRGLIARDALTGAVPLVQHAREAILDGDSETALDDLDEVQRRAATAAALTSDPVWRAAEIVPFAGQNLIAFREAATVIDDVARDALPPLAELATDLDFTTFVPVDGALDAQPIIDARPLLEQSAAAMERAATAAAAIRTDNTVPQIGEAVDQLVDLVDETTDLVSGVSGAAQILPDMLGGDGPRSYLLLVLNNAELRAAGGIPGALAIINADNGRLTLGQQTSAASFGNRGEPLAITDVEQTLYSDNLGLYMQNVTATPDFTRTAQLATERWREVFGEELDGVLSVDPIALSYILRASGAVDVGEGVSLTADNVVETLLSDTYARYADPADQDAFFTRTAAAVFERMVDGDLDPKVFIDGLVQAGGERRILVWSAHADEQEVIARGSISGPPIESTDDHTGFGVYLHDNTESKMDWYLGTAIGVASVECRNDDRPYYEVRVQLTSTAPADAAESLPDYVTGSSGEGRGLVQGQIRTTAYVYAPVGGVIYDARINGLSTAYIASDDVSNVVAGITIDLDPGETVLLSFHVLGAAGWPLPIALEHTPTAFEVPVSVDNLLACPVLPSEPTT
jgi:hypothetical protein